MLMPSIFRENLFDNFFEDFAFPDVNKVLYGKHAGNLMKTDVKEVEDGYVVDIDLPGFRKDDIKMQLDEKNEEGSYVRRERYSGSMSRSFYVGAHVTEEDIHPKYENGILTFHIPKEEKKALEEKQHYIAIEG